MQTHFERELEKLKNRILKMGNLAQQQVSIAIEVLLKGQFEQLETVATTEHKIDKLDVKVDKLCQRIFALKQPVAVDLRFIMSSLQIGNELERIGDIAMSIINKSEMIREQPEILIKFNIEQVISESFFLIQKSFQNYSEYDSKKIEEVISESHNLKEKCQVILENIIVEMTQKSEVIIVATHLILILKQIERLADHASNIAESIYFMNEAAIIKHGKKEGQSNLEITDQNESFQDDDEDQTNDKTNDI